MLFAQPNKKGKRQVLANTRRRSGQSAQQTTRSSKERPVKPETNQYTTYTTSNRRAFHFFSASSSSTLDLTAQKAQHYDSHSTRVRYKCSTIYGTREAREDSSMIEEGASESVVGCGLWAIMPHVRTLFCTPWAHITVEACAAVLVHMIRPYVAQQLRALLRTYEYTRALLLLQSIDQYDDNGHIQHTHVPATIEYIPKYSSTSITTPGSYVYTMQCTGTQRMQ